MNRARFATTIVSHSSICEIEIDFSQPLKRGRNIFGSLVPYGHVWRTGANGCTTIYTSQDLQFEGETLPRGKYAIYTVPRPDVWTILFYSDIDSYGLPKRWNDDLVGLAVEAPSRVSASIAEAFTVTIRQKSHDVANIEFAWDQTCVSIPFAIPSQSNALVDAVPSSGGPSFDDYYMAARFCYDTGDLRGALLRINMGLELNSRKPYFYHRLKSLIESALGATSDALNYARVALERARDAGDADYVQLVQKDIAHFEQQYEDTAPKKVNA